MEYLNIFFIDFLGRQVSIPYAAYVGVIHLSNLIKNIFICGPKKKQRSYGVGTAWG